MELKVAKFKTNQTKAVVSSLPSSSGWERQNSEPQISAMRLGSLGAISEDYLLRMFAELISTIVFLLLLRGLLEWVSISVCCSHFSTFALLVLCDSVLLSHQKPLLAFLPLYVMLVTANCLP